MAISDEAFNQAQEYEIKYTIKYKWREEWKKLYREYLRTFLEISNSFPESVVVDVGCGPVGIITVLEAKEKIGIDPLIDEYKKRFDMEPDVRYINAKGEEIPLQDGYADVVFCVNTLNHVQNPDKVLSEIARILKPKGRLYFDVHDNLLSIGHPHLFTMESMYLLLSKHFKIDKSIRRNKIPVITYVVYCEDCGRLLDSPTGLKHGQACSCGSKKRKNVLRHNISKTKIWGSICSSLKS